MRKTPTPKVDQQYIDLSHHIRQLEIEELKSGNYPHLRNPNRKVKLPKEKKDHNFLEERFRPKYLFRQGLPLRQGKRNLQVGRIEIILEYFGTPKDNILDGFVLDKERPLRVIAGEFIDNTIRQDVRKYQENPLVYHYLTFGKYKEFVQVTLKETNYLLSLAKKNKKAEQFFTQ